MWSLSTLTSHKIHVCENLRYETSRKHTCTHDRTFIQRVTRNGPRFVANNVRGNVHEQDVETIFRSRGYISDSHIRILPRFFAVCTNRLVMSPFAGHFIRASRSCPTARSILASSLKCFVLIRQRDFPALHRVPPRIEASDCIRNCCYMLGERLLVPCTFETLESLRLNLFENDNTAPTLQIRYLCM